jgi:hypothetical protein
MRWQFVQVFSVRTGFSRASTTQKAHKEMSHHRLMRLGWRP